MTKFQKMPEAAVDSDRPWDDDVFETLQEYAEFLTNALLADPGPFVLNVNGAWGSGKTFFVQRWAVDLRKQNYPVVEFNAWENDAEADPLTCLLAECIEALGEHVDKRTKILKGLQEKGGRIAVSLGKIATQAVIRKALGDDGARDLKDLFSKETEKELIALGGSLVEEQIRKKTERKAFVDELKNLVTQLQKNAKGPVFIFIDELDRCRPTFAIELLERVKHLFNVDGIKFVVSTDTGQLVHSIGGAYGASFDGATYLQRFFDETFTLPEPNNEAFARRLFAELRAANEQLDDAWISYQGVESSFRQLADGFGLTLRQQLQAFHRIKAVVSVLQPSPQKPFHYLYAATLIMIRFVDIESYDLLLHGENPTNRGRSSGRNERFQMAREKLDFRGTIFRFLITYFRLSDGSKKDAMKMANEYADSNERGSSQYDEDVQLNSLIMGSCFEHYVTFSNYPKLIELTETLSEDTK